MLILVWISIYTGDATAWLKWELEIVLSKKEGCSNSEGYLKEALFLRLQFLFECNEQVASFIYRYLNGNL